MRRRAGIAVLALLLLVAAAARPAAAACLAVEVVALPTLFGSYDPAAAQPRTSTGSVTVTCTGLPSGTASYEILLSPGNAGSFSPREMTNLGETLGYNLYTDASHLLVWGDESEGSATVSDGYTLPALGTGVRDYTVYGVIFAGQSVPAGLYTDHIFVTVSF